MSNNRICIYLSSKQAVDVFFGEQGGEFSINGNFIKTRRLQIPSERLVLSNVCPSIPNDVILSELRGLGVNIISPIMPLRVGTKKPEYNHILSFRRQLYVTPSNNLNIPDSIIIQDDNTSYRIYLTFDNQNCHKCKQTGHIASKCPNAEQNTSLQNLPEINNSQNIFDGEKNPQGNPSQVNPTESTSKTANISLSLLKNTIRSTQDDLEKRMDYTENCNKRPLSETSSPIAESDSAFKIPDTLKKYKSDECTSEQMQPVKQLMEKDPKNYALTFEQLTYLLSNIKGNPDPISIIRNYTSGFEDLVDTI